MADRSPKAKKEMKWAGPNTTVEVTTMWVKTQGQI